MSNFNRRLFAGLALLIGSTVCVRSIHGQAANEQIYTLASFRGDYAVVGTGGANVAGLLGTIVSDGQGGVSGAALANLPGSTSRTLAQITYTGTYTINADGTGVLTVTVTLPSGRTATGTVDLLITKARRSNATDIAGMQRELVSALNGQLVVYKFTKRSR